MRELAAAHPALKGSTIFLKQVKPPSSVKRLLQPASMNAKLGAGKTHITKGKWKGMPMYQLTLEERKTCPKTCDQWRTCYGNNMPFANRIDHEDKDFYATLDAELATLSTKHAQGFVVRLHVLGDFYSVKYVDWWTKKLSEHTGLRVFGYTHRLPDSPIGRAIQRFNDAGAWIRWSDIGDLPMAANVAGPGIVCPQQTGRTASCLTCGLCWAIMKPIQFLRH